MNTPSTTTGNMKAAILTDWNRLEVADTPIPQPESGEVLVKVRACGLCGTDLKMVAGGFEGTWPPSLPFILGHEWSGEVVGFGPNTDALGLEIGDRVIAENHAGCWACANCRAGRYNLCLRVNRPGYKLYGHTAPGSLAEYASRPVTALHKIPDSISDPVAALLNQSALAVHAFRRLQFRAGSTVAIFGPGLLGLVSAAVAKAAGATRIIMVGRGERLNTAKVMGCTDIVDYTDGDPVAAVRELTGGLGVDAVVDATGNPPVIDQALDVCARGGKVAVLGLNGKKVSEVVIDKLVLDEIDLLGVRSSPNAYGATIALVASGAIDLEPLAQDTYSMDQVDDAFAALKNRTSIRSIVLP